MSLRLIEHRFLFTQSRPARHKYQPTDYCKYFNTRSLSARNFTRCEAAPGVRPASRRLNAMQLGLLLAWGAVHAAPDTAPTSPDIPMFAFNFVGSVMLEEVDFSQFRAQGY